MPLVYNFDMLKLQHANAKDLAAINKLIDAAVMSWDLPERVKRLSLPSYHYDELDLSHYEIVIAKQGNQLLGLAAWEVIQLKDIPLQHSGLLLHGIFVCPDTQRQGVGTFLLHATENAAVQQGLSGVLVKAQTDAVVFFIKQGFKPVKVINPSSDYANRLWKSSKIKIP